MDTIKIRLEDHLSAERSKMTDHELLDDIEREMRQAFEHDLSFQVAQRFFRIRGRRAGKTKTEERV